MINRHPSRRVVVSVASGLSAAVLAVAGAGVALAHHDVTLEVDGVAMPVSGFNNTVADVLGSAGVQLGDHDLVAPATDQAVANGQTVVVRTAKPYTVTVDGKLVQAWSTGDSAQDVLADVAGTGKVVMAADRSFAREPLPVLGGGGTVAVLADGKSKDVRASADAGADQLLKEAGVKVSAIDRVVLEQQASGVVLRVTRVERGERTEEKALAHGSEKKDDDTLEKGEQKVVQEGRDGSVRTTFYEETVDGKATVSVKVAEKRAAPVNEIIAVGTKEPVVEAAPAVTGASSGSSAGTAAHTGTGSAPAGDWAALAQCESGGNPQAVNPAGYYGLYQFDLQTWQSVGGQGNPADASAAEQTARAQQLYNERGWSPWGCASIVGLN